MLLGLLLAVTGAGARRAAPDAAAGSVEVVVTLPQPGLADATLRDRTLAAATGARRRLNLRAPAATSYLRTLARAQARFAARLATTIPQARVRWRFGVVLDGVSVILPRAELANLRRIPGAHVWPSLTYHALLDRSPSLIGATAFWGPTLANAGEGMKIGIIDDGVDAQHPFFSAAGYAYPPGFPKGQTRLTTPKVIVQRAFAPATEKYKYARVPFDPSLSEHATHVAGIAAGDYGTTATDPTGAKVTVSGIAPRAYLGNYKVLTVPTREFGLDGNSPEIAAAIEQAVKDGMDVINLSLGEPEIDPSRDIVVKAIDGAAAANVVPVVAAGNDFDVAGRGSIGSPGSAPDAITAAASTNRRGEVPDVIASFSSSGPNPVSLGFKPDVTAPGEGILSSVPPHDGTWDVFDGTSMATPHVAGAAALLRQTHPSWTVAQIKSALSSTGDPVKSEGAVGETLATREGGGRIDLLRADQPLVFTSPTSLSFGLLRVGAQRTETFDVADAGGGPAPWTVSVQQQSADAGVTVAATPAVAAPGTVSVTVTAASTAGEADLTGFVVLARADQTRRIPYWVRVERPRLGDEPRVALTHPGVYRGDLRRGQSLVSSYRYPERGPAAGIPASLPGPELVYRIDLTRAVANFGAVVVARTGTVQPRLVFADDENHLVGYTGLPVDLNPYQDFGRLTPAVGAVLPAAGTYDLVFDTTSAGAAGPFTFRYWIGDTTPPAVKLVRRTAGALVLGVADGGSGVDPASLHASVDGHDRAVRWNGRAATISLAGLRRGAHRIVFVASDFQETKNMEDVGPVLPNTRVFRTTVRVR